MLRALNRGGMMMMMIGEEAKGGKKTEKIANVPPRRLFVVTADEVTSLESGFTINALLFRLIIV